MKVSLQRIGKSQAPPFIARRPLQIAEACAHVNKRDARLKEEGAPKSIMALPNLAFMHSFGALCPKYALLWCIYAVSQGYPTSASH